MVKIISQYFLLFLIAFLCTQTGFSQERGGEIADTEIIIEKDKPLTLPKANRLYQPTELTINQFQPAPIQYSFNPVDFQPEGYSSSPAYRKYIDNTESVNWDNYVKLGFGNYQSPLIEGNYTMRIDEHYFNTFLHHESFAKGPVREEQSAFSDSQIKLKGHLDGDFHVDPFLNWSRESYYFYGRDTAFDDSNPFIIDDRIFLQNISLGAEVRQGMENNFYYEFTPQFRSTLNKVVGGDRIGSETEISLDGMVAYNFSDQLSFGVGYGLARHKYESVFLQYRNYLSLNPAITYKLPGGSISAGFEVASATDTTSESSSLYFFPDIAINLDLTSDLSIYGALSGNLQVITLNDISRQNRYLESGLLLLNQVNKIDVTAGVRTRIIDQFQLDAALGYSVIENLPLFNHDLIDSSRFITVYDSAGIVRTSLGVNISYFSGKQFSVNYQMKFFGYSMNKLAEPWYQPTSLMNLLLNYHLSEKLKLNLNGMMMGGIKAPSPLDLSIVELPTFFDMGIGADFAINEQFSAFGDVRNLIGSYERYLNYPVRGLTFKLGMAYRF